MTKKKWYSILISLSLVLVLAMVACLTNFTNTTQQTRTTTIEVSRQEIDYQSLLDGFDNSKLEHQGSLTTFEGYKSLNLADLEGIDLTSDSTLSENTEVDVKYNFSYDNETNIVTLSAELKDEFGEIQIDTIKGAAFINDYGEIDAVMNVDGEGILLSEMQDAGMIANCGWFSRLIKTIVKVAVVAVAIAAVAVATAAVVVATAGAAAPALVAAGVGITTSTTLGTTVGLAAGTLFVATVGMSAIKAGTAVAEKLGDGAEQIIDKTTGTLLEIVLNKVSYAVRELTDAVRYELENGVFLLALADKSTGKMMVSTILVTISVASLGMKAGISCYTPSFADAYDVAKLASDGNIPVHDYAHQSGYFNHYHRAGRTGVAHAFYGFPQGV